MPPTVPAKPKGTYPYNYAAGGAYWLSRKAMTIVADAQPNGDWAEDRFVGDTLGSMGFWCSAFLVTCSLMATCRITGRYWY